MSHPGTFTSHAVRDLMTRAMFYRVLCEVLGIDHDDLLLKALDGNGIVSLDALLALTDYQIDTMSFDDGTGVWLSPSLASRNKIRVLRSWHSHLQLVQGSRDVNWLDHSSVNEDEWEDYRVAVYAPFELPKSPVSRPRPGPRVATPLRSVPAAIPVVDSPSSDPCLVDELVVELDPVEIVESVAVVVPMLIDDGERSKGEFVFGPDEALGFESNSISPGSSSAGVIMGVAMVTDCHFCDDINNSNTLVGAGVCKVLVDCHKDESCLAERVSHIGMVEIELVSENVNSIKMEVDHEFDITTGVASTFDCGGETNVVFDPGGVVFGGCDEFFGCDWFTPAPEQYLDLLLLDRGE